MVSAELKTHRPSNFYYAAKKNGSQYSNDAIGALSVERLVQGKPCFKTSAPTIVWKKKTIVLADWTASQWSDEKIRNAGFWLNQIKSMGHPVYIWQQGELVPFNGTLSPQLREKITPATHKEISLVAREKKITQDQLMIMDDYALHSLITYEGSERTFDAENLRLTKHNRNTVRGVLQQASPPIKKIRCRTYPQDVAMATALLPDIPLLCEFKSITYMEGSQLEEIVKNGSIFPKGELPVAMESIETITLTGKGDAFALNLKDFLSKSVNLKELNLDGCQEISGNICEHALDKLEILNLRNTTFSNWKNVLKNAPNLKVLVITGHEIPIKMEGMLPQLEAFSLEKAVIRGKELNELLQKAPELFHLSLKDCKNSYDPFLSAPNFSLRSLCLENSAFSSEYFKNLLHKFPKLRLLNLKNCQGLPDTWGAGFNHLFDLDLTQSSITCQSLNNLLQETPALQRLDLSNCKKLSGTITFQAPLYSLDSLNVSGTPFSCESLLSLLEMTPNLVKLQWDDCPQFAEDKLPEKLKQRLEGVTVSYSQSKAKGQHRPSSQPIHRPEAHLNKMVVSPFTYRGIQTKSQAMVIDRVSQYLLLSRSNTNWIPRLQKGMCNALSHYFSSQPIEDWKRFLSTVASWDGRSETLKPYSKVFEDFLPFIYEYQFNPKGEKTWVCDNLRRLLSQYTGSDALILCNPWHATTVRRTGDNQWFFYEPNREDGGTYYTLDELLKNIQQSIGDLISIKGDVKGIDPLINNPKRFIENGGLLALCNASNRDALLKALNPSSLLKNNLPEAVLRGLFLRDVNDVPAVLHGLKKASGKDINALTEGLVKQYRALGPEKAARLDALLAERIAPQVTPSKPKHSVPRETKAKLDKQALVFKKEPVKAQVLPQKSAVKPQEIKPSATYRLPASLFRTWENK
ncbi:MAG: hypothetical protein WC785_09070, partial [Tatlockia sp.]